MLWAFKGVYDLSETVIQYLSISELFLIRHLIYIVHVGKVHHLGIFC